METFYGISGSAATLHCPLQPGALVGHYYGSWERNGEILVEIAAPNNGIPQGIVRSDSRYDLDRTTFSLIINSVDATDADDGYICSLFVYNPEATAEMLVSLQTDVTQLSLMVNGKHISKGFERLGGVQEAFT